MILPAKSRETAVTVDTRNVTDIDRVAKALLVRGLRLGDRIGCWSPMAEEHVMVQAAAFRIGLVVVHFDPEWNAEAVYRHLEATTPKMMFVRAYHEGVQYPALLKSLIGRLAALPEMVVHGRQRRFETILPGGWMTFLNSGDSAAPDVLAVREFEVETMQNSSAGSAILTAARPADSYA
jgi:fatty-acyl-CoA synthase